VFSGAEKFRRLHLQHNEGKDSERLNSLVRMGSRKKGPITKGRGGFLGERGHFTSVFHGQVTLSMLHRGTLRVNTF